MDTPAVSTFVAILALACWCFVAVVGVLAIAHRFAPDSRGGRADEIGASALWLAWVVALVTTLGSLYYCTFAHFVPCSLCWYQRIAMLSTRDHVVRRGAAA